MENGDGWKEMESFHLKKEGLQEEDTQNLHVDF